MKLKNIVLGVLVLLGMEFTNLFAGNVLRRLTTQDSESYIQQIQRVVQKGDLEGVKAVLQKCDKDSVRLNAVLAMNHATPYLYEIMRELFVGKSNLLEVKYFKIGQNNFNALEYFAYKGIPLALLIAFDILLAADSKKRINSTDLHRLAIKGMAQFASTPELRDAYVSIIDSFQILAATRSTSAGVAAADAGQ